MTETTITATAAAALRVALQTVNVNLLSLREVGIAGFCASASLKQMAQNSLSEENKKYVQCTLKKLGIE